MGAVQKIPNLNNYFDFHVCLFIRGSVRASENYLQFLQLYQNLSWYVLWVGMKYKFWVILKTLGSMRRGDIKIMH